MPDARGAWRLRFGLALAATIVHLPVAIGWAIVAFGISRTSFLGAPPAGPVAGVAAVVFELTPLACLAWGTRLARRRRAECARWLITGGIFAAFTTFNVVSAGLAIAAGVLVLRRRADE